MLDRSSCTCSSSLRNCKAVYQIRVQYMNLGWKLARIVWVYQYDSNGRLQHSKMTDLVKFFCLFNSYVWLCLSSHHSHALITEQHHDPPLHT